MLVAVLLVRYLLSNNLAGTPMIVCLAVVFFRPAFGANLVSKNPISRTNMVVMIITIIPLSLLYHNNHLNDNHQYDHNDASGYLNITMLALHYHNVFNCYKPPSKFWFLSCCSPGEAMVLADAGAFAGCLGSTFGAVVDRGDSGQWETRHS